MPCPYFNPESKCDRLLWQHSSRLPLGAGWQGSCHAPGHEGAQPDDDDLRAHCNLGYAAGCSRMPATADADAVRFGVFRKQADAEKADPEKVIEVHFIREKNHLPVDHGALVFDAQDETWPVTHSDKILQRQAECFLQSWREKNRRP